MCSKDLFPVILTDNGSEFKHVIEMETTETMENRMQIFYCDPMASWQKPHIEKNHEFIRYVIPKGRSMGFLTNEKVIRLMNHINSVKRNALNGKSPYELMHTKQCWQKNLEAPTPVSEYRQEFWKDYQREGIEFIMRKYGRLPFKTRVKNKIAKIIRGGGTHK